MKRVEDSLAIFRRDAWTSVLHLKCCAARPDIDREIDSAAFRRIADRVVDQVSHQHRQIALPRAHHNVLLTNEPNIQALGLRQWHQVLEHLSKHANETHWLRLAGFILRPSQRKQLIEQASRSLDATAQN